MRSEIKNIAMSEDIIDFVCGEMEKPDVKTALISGGKRPFLFINKKLASKAGKAFIPPAFFTNDDFIETSVFENSKLVKIPDVEAAYMIYEAVKEEAPELLKEKNSFAEFLQWSLEILAFIEHLDLEKVSADKLKNIQANADIGYDVPENINNLMKSIFKIRDSFHRSLDFKGKTTKGYSFLKASDYETGMFAGDFDRYILLAPFYLHRTELEIFKKFFDSGKLTVITQGNPCEHEILKKIYGAFNFPLPASSDGKKEFELNVYSAYDDQSQAAVLRKLAQGLSPEEQEKSVIIVPDSKNLQSVIAEISQVTDNYNISAGYPASKTAVFSLIKAVMQAQLSRQGGEYYVRDIINVLSNPLVKNMRFFSDASLSRITVHKLEQAFDADSKNSLSGKIFVSFDEISSNSKLLESISENVAGTSGYIGPEKIKAILSGMFDMLFSSWQETDTLSSFGKNLEKFVSKIAELSVAESYPLNPESMEIILDTARQLQYGSVSSVRFRQNDIINIFTDLTENKKISLPGSPLKGIQILGLLESRNLSFENVFIVGMTDAALPAVKKESALVPRDIMFALGIEMAKKEYDIQNYHFQRLISGSKKLNIIYPDNEKDERSRFAEKLIWERQYESGNINAVKIKSFAAVPFSAKSGAVKRYEKTDEIQQYLKNMRYSYSKIDSYLRCRLEFYFRYVLGLDETAEIGRELSGSDIGSFIHDFLKEVFHEGFESRELNKKDFKEEYTDKLERFFESNFDLKFREDAFLIKKILHYRMADVLEFEKSRKYDYVYRCEKKYASTLDSGKNTFNLECIIDRIDKCGNSFYILDYKTGKTEIPVISRNFDSVMSKGFKRENVKKAVKSLQLPIYRYIFEKTEGIKAGCGIYDIKKADISDLFSNIEMPEEVFTECIGIIKNILEEIVSGEYFEADPRDKENCKDCKFFYICR